MMMNKKGFTLVELLVVVSVIALIAIIAIPNIVGLSDGIKKDQMLDDAKKLISLAKYRVNSNSSIRELGEYTFTFSELNGEGDITQDPDSTSNPPQNYLSGTVTYTNTGGIASYCVYLEGSRRKVSQNGNECVPEENLYSRTNVVDK